MRHLLILIIAFSIGPLSGSASAVPGAFAGASADCIHQSADMPHHGGEHHQPEKQPPPCCAGFCLILATLVSGPAESIAVAHATVPFMDSRGEARDIEPADPPPRS